MSETFDFKFFTENTEYKDESRAIKMGGGWEYTVEPLVADPRVFHLQFGALVWYTNMVDGREVVDINIEPDTNAGRMDDFYNRHRLHKPFYFNHPRYGVTKVRFEAPLDLGQPVENSGGVVKGVSIKLLEVL